MSKGKFIVIDGLDGAGKTSSIEYLREHLPKDVVFTKEPGGTPFGETMRKILKEEQHDPLTELFLFCADRREHMKNVIIPALEGGHDVICDRFMSTTYAFQIYGKGNMHLDPLFWDLHEAILKGYSPDLYLFVTISPEIARTRMKKRISMDHFEKDMEFQARAREGFALFFKKVKMKEVDGGKDLLEMQKDVLGLVKDALRS